MGRWRIHQAPGAPTLGLRRLRFSDSMDLSSSAVRVGVWSKNSSLRTETEARRANLGHHSPTSPRSLGLIPPEDLQPWVEHFWDTAPPCIARDDATSWMDPGERWDTSNSQLG